LSLLKNLCRSEIPGGAFALLRGRRERLGHAIEPGKKLSRADPFDDFVDFGFAGRRALLGLFGRKAQRALDHRQIDAAEAAYGARRVGQNGDEGKVSEDAHDAEAVLRGMVAKASQAFGFGALVGCGIGC
jgi:hypothetical protein